MFSRRLGKKVVLTEHARRRMADRDIAEATLMDVLEHGEIRYRDPAHLWIAMNVAGRNDNMVCLAAVAEETLVIKTVMHHFSWEETP